MIRTFVFIAGGMAGLWLAYTFWFTLFERTVWRLFWDSLTDFPSGGNKPALESILNSSLFLKACVSFFGTGVLTLFLLSRK